MVARIDDGVRNAAYTIINGKDATWFGIGAGLARIVRAIARDEQAVLSVSIVTAEVEGVHDAALSVPRVVGATGVSADLFPVLDDFERAALARSAILLKETSGSLETRGQLTRVNSHRPAGERLSVVRREIRHG